MAHSGAFWAYDLDGVICVDHVHGLGPGDPEYENHIDLAEPLILPGGFLLIVTGRLEKYHERTKRWLDGYGLIYKLITKPITLRGIDKTPRFKADIYRKSNATVFIESHTWQARVVAEISGKPVFSMENKKLYCNRRGQ